MQSTPIFINEFQYLDTYSKKFIELAGPAGTNLMGWSTVLYKGSNKKTYARIVISDIEIQDYRRTGYGIHAFTISEMQNVLGGIAFVNGSGSCVQFLSFGGAFKASNGPCKGFISTNIAETDVDKSLQLVGNGLVYEDFVWDDQFPATRDKINMNQSFGGTVMINEIVKEPNGKSPELIELFGTPGTSLAGLSVIFVESDDVKDFGKIERQIDLPLTAALGGNGFYLIGNKLVEKNLKVKPDLIISRNFIKDGSYTIALIRMSVLDNLRRPLRSNSASKSQPKTLDAFAVRHSTSDTDFFFNAPIYGPQDGVRPSVIRRYPDGSKTIVVDASSISGKSPVAATGGVILFIDEIKGAGESSSYDGNLVSVTGVVVGDFQNDDADTARYIQGFFLQQEEKYYDDDALTSEGIFVFEDAGNVDVSVGDLVTVIGTVAKYFGETQITDIVSIVIRGTAPLPSPADISLLSMNRVSVSQDGDYQPDLHAYEGMIVRFPTSSM